MINWILYSKYENTRLAMTNLETAETWNRPWMIDQKIQSLEAKILDQGNEYILTHDEDLRNSFDETVKKIEFSNHLQYIWWWSSENQKTSPKIGYHIDFWGISVPASTKYQLYKRTSWIKMDWGWAEFYVDFAQVAFEPLIFEWNSLSTELVQKMQKYCLETKSAIDQNNLTKVEAHVVIRDLYWANHSTEVWTQWKTHLNRPQNLEEVIIEYHLTDNTWKKVKITSRNYFTHASALPWSENLYNVASPINKVWPVKPEIKVDMINYRKQLLNMMETQADLNHNNKIESQLDVIGRFFRPVINQNAKEDIPSLQKRISAISQNISLTNTGIIINDPRWKETVEEMTWNKNWVLENKDVLLFLSRMMQKYWVTESKVSAYIPMVPWKESISWEQFDMLRDGMWKFPELDQKFAMLSMREQSTLTLYQSQKGWLYYWWVGWIDQIRDQSWKILRKRRTMKLEPDSLKTIIIEAYSQYVCARTWHERTHIEEVSYLIQRQGLDTTKKYPNPKEEFKRLISSESFQGQFQNTYDFESNNNIKWTSWSVSRFKGKNWEYKLWISHWWKYVVFSETATWFRVEENWKSFDLSLSWNDLIAINWFLWLIEIQLKSINDEYNKNISNRTTKY